MRIRSRTLAAAVVTAVVAATLAGCVPVEPGTEPTSSTGEAATAPVSTDPAPASSTAPTASDPGSPTPTPGVSGPPEPAMSDATSLLIGPTSFSLVDASGAGLGTWDYRNGTGAIAALTEAFGSTPTESDDVPYEGFRSRAYTWPGFTVKDTEVYDAGDPEPEYPEPDFLVGATAPAVGDVAVSTLGGVSVGDATADVRAEHPESAGAGAAGLFLFDATSVGSSDGSDLVNSVMAIADDEVTISAIRAPSANWGV
ncbi:hypothetical protein [Rathayibacter tanaceti]|uniref:Uncharacterized protein n=2 Tax=Rathayibacter tanaceti TaxID=1671680 RepID=A0A166IKH1_9MICO|nr:hypothetical protein [Rathayibacter tanaceti]KZX22526.1 hypothetical protein ACH61_00292 [Rathayibacter tanaceti]QHC54795.1 hypothetical protein GSU10_03450 [Rathayibacter tanaceti]TCO37382.1 hypothetical protein EV639_10447 [Rathayibacter tanaceti]